MIRRLIALTIVAALAFAGGFVVGTNGRRDLTSFTADKARDFTFKHVMSSIKHAAATGNTTIVLSLYSINSEILRRLEKMGYNLDYDYEKDKVRLDW
jgi:hypothetical protein